MKVLPREVQGSKVQSSKVVAITVPIKNDAGELLPTAIPKVTIVKHARYLPEDTTGNTDEEVDILARIEKNLVDARWLDLLPKVRRPSAP
jgi:hypothetical protein